MIAIKRTPIWPDPRVQPPYGSAELDRSHPLLGAGRVVSCVLHNEGVGPPLDLARHYRSFFEGTTPGWQSGSRGGLSINYTSVNTSTNIGVEGTSITLPLTRCTVAMIRRKTDTTNRASSAFGSDEAGSRLSALMPYSDGTVYWDFGGSSGANRLTYAYSVSTNWESWAFTAGTTGSSIHLNGVQRASQATGISRTASTVRVSINRGSADGDLQEVAYFLLLEQEWTRDQVAAWTAEPYSFLRPILRRRYFVPAGVAQSVVPVLMAQYRQRGS